MGKLRKIILATALMTPLFATAGPAEIEKGKKIAFDRKKGNCLACHMIPGGELPGNTAPPLLQMKARYPKKAVLTEQIWDARKRNPLTIMPPFGTHNILSADEIDLLIEYLYTL